MRLNRDQRKALSDFANMIAAAWFTAGVIAPAFAKTKSLQDIIVSLTLGIIMTATILMISLSFLSAKRI